MKIKFSDKITLTYTGADEMFRENKLWIRTQVFNKYFNLQPDDYFVFCIPPDYTDGASIPRFFWTIITPTDWRILYPSQPHDWLYTQLGKGEKYITGFFWNKRTNKVKKKVTIEFNRKDADKIIVEKMKSFGAGMLLRFLVYISLRPFGYFVIKNKKQTYEKVKNFNFKHNE